MCYISFIDGCRASVKYFYLSQTPLLHTPGVRREPPRRDRMQYSMHISYLNKNIAFTAKRVWIYCNKHMIYNSLFPYKSSTGNILFNFQNKHTNIIYLWPGNLGLLILKIITNNSAQYYCLLVPVTFMLQCIFNIVVFHKSVSYNTMP